jgi:uncharacterized protein with HEPN domain
MDNRNIKIIKNMVGFAEKILLYCSGITRESFLENEQLIDACASKLTQLGESVNSLDDEFMDMHDNIPWHKMRGVRNRIVHDYMRLDLQMVWEIVSNDLPDLIQRLNEIAGN